MERVKQNWSQQTLRQLLGDIKNAENLNERMAILQQSRKQHHSSKVDITNLILLSHSHALNMLDDPHASNEEYLAAAAAASYVGLDNVVINHFRDGKATSAHVLVGDMVHALYARANDDRKQLLDLHYSDMYGVDCQQIIKQVTTPEIKHHLVPKIDAKKAATTAIGASVLAATTFGIAAGASAAETPDYKLATSVSSSSTQSFELNFDSFTDPNGTVITGETTPPASDTPQTETATPEVNTTVDDGYNSFDDGGKAKDNAIDLGDATPDGPQSFNLDSVTPDMPGDTPETPVMPDTPEVTEPTPPNTAEDEANKKAEEEKQAEQEKQAEEKRQAEKEQKEKEAAEKKAEKEKQAQSDAEKEAAKYKVYTDYVRANVASLQGNSKWHPLDADTVIKLIDKWYEEYKHLNDGVIDREYMAAVLWQESKYDPNASSGVAFGIGQFTKATAKGLGLSNVWDPDESIKMSFEYYNDIYSKFDNYSNKYNWDKSIDTVKHKLEMALAGYNAGPNYKVFRKGGFPDFRETNGYRAIIMGDYGDMKKAQKEIGGDTKPQGEKKKEKKEKETKEFKAVGYSVTLDGDQKLIIQNQRFDNGNSPYAGGAMKDYGCSPSTLATVISSLEGRVVSNVEVGNKFKQYGAVVNGNGTNRMVYNNPNFGLFQDYNIRVERVSLKGKSFQKVIDKGGMVVMRHYGGVFASSNGRNFGHFMAVTGYNNNHSEWDNVDRKFYIFDPNGNKGNGYTNNADGFSFSTIKGGEGRARTGNMTDAWAVYIESGKPAPKTIAANHDDNKTSHKKKADTNNAKKKQPKIVAKPDSKPPKAETAPVEQPTVIELSEPATPDINDILSGYNATPNAEPEQPAEPETQEQQPQEQSTDGESPTQETTTPPTEQQPETLDITPPSEQRAETPNTIPPTETQLPDQSVIDLSSVTETPTAEPTEQPPETIAIAPTATPEKQHNDKQSAGTTTLHDGDTVSLRNQAPTISPEAQKIIDEQLEHARQVQRVIDEALQNAKK